MTSPAPRGARTAVAIAVAALLALAAFVRLETLGQRPLWLDERWTEATVRDADDAAAIWQVGSLDEYQHPPLYFLAAWVAARGEPTATRLRAPAAAAGIAAVALELALGALLFGPRVGLLAAFLAAISLYHVEYSQDARPYMQGVAFTLALYTSLFAFLLRRERRWLLAFVAAAAGALYTYHLAVLHVACAAAIALAHELARAARGEAPRFAPLALAFGAVGLAFLPGLSGLLGFLREGQLGPHHVLDVTPRVLHEIAARWGSGRGATTLLYEATFLLGVARVALRGDTVRRGLLLWGSAPVLVFALLPFAKYFDLRFLISALPVFHLLAAAGADDAARTLGRLAAGGVRRESVAALARGGALLLLTAAFALPAARLYRVFRAMDVRCSELALEPERLEREGRFCSDHLLLSTIHPDQQFLVRSRRGGVELDPAALDAYVGTYRFAPGVDLEISRRGERLFAQQTGRFRNELVAESESRFHFRAVQGLLRFERDASGAVDALVLHRWGRSARAERVREEPREPVLRDTPAR